RILTEQFHPAGYGNGLADLLRSSSDAINPSRLAGIKTTDTAIPSEIIDKQFEEDKDALKAAGKDVAAATKMSYPDATEAADRSNSGNQVVIGAKEGIVDGFKAKLGESVTDSVLLNAEGTDEKGLDEFELHELVQASFAAAEVPRIRAARKLLVAVTCYEFDWRLQVATNVNALRNKAGKLLVFGTSLRDDQLATIILANAEGAALGSWGREINAAVDKLRRAYPYNHKHDATSLRAILKELAVADNIRDLRAAPAPTGQAAAAFDYDRSQVARKLVFDDDDDDTSIDDTVGTAASARGYDSSSSEDTRATGRKSRVRKKPSYITLSNAYATLPDFAVDPPEPEASPQAENSGDRIKPDNFGANPKPSKFKRKTIARFLKRQLKREKYADEASLLDRYIEEVEDERTALARQDTTNPQFVAAETAHNGASAKAPSAFQSIKNLGYTMRTQAKRAMHNILKTRRRVTFADKAQSRTFWQAQEPIMVTYDSGADGHYISEHDRSRAKLPILRRSHKRVGVANGTVCNGKHVTQLPIPRMPPKAAEAHTFEDFPHSLMSVGKTSDAGTISIFTQDGVTIHDEKDVLITCKGAPILIGVRDSNGRYRIPLVQQRGQWQPRKPSKKAKSILRQANSVYDLPSTEQAIKWMHAVCGYPVKSTWLAAIEAGNFVGWPLLTVRNVKKYYPETTETPKGHMNQTRKNVRTTKAPPQPFERCDTSKLKGKKERDIFTKVYDVRETIYSDQTGQFPTRSMSGNKYVMVMVEIDSSGILVEPMKNRTDNEMIRAYQTLVQRLQRANITPRKHVLDNEVSESMKELIRSKYNMQLELVPPGCHRRNAAEVAIRNFKSHFLSILAGVADDFPLQLWDRLLPQAEITLNLLRQSNATPTVSAYAHMSGPFDYNKMPLAPMGCKVQVHEKTDKRGTWAFHSVDGWYLSTSPEHYRTHKCHIKDTKSDRLSDTVQFQHKNITNPSVTPYDKIMHALSDCAKAIKGINNVDAAQDIRDIQRISQIADADRENSKSNLDQASVPRVRPAPRVEEAPLPDNRRLTRSMVPDTPAPPRVPPTTAYTPVAPRATVKRRRRSNPPPVVPPTAPARNTRSQTTAAATMAAPPALNTRSARAKATASTPATPSRADQARRAHVQRIAAANNKSKRNSRRLALRVARLENEVHQALAVLDKQSGKMLNYRQLLRHPDYKKPWRISSANEFGRLANGIGGRIKNPTKTIRFIRRDDIPKDRRKDVTYGQFVCTERPEKSETNRSRLVIGGDRINYPGEVATPTAEMLVAKLLFNSV
ncbi:hypothetical protein ACHAWF_006436, partial [Thalassiosira exigua]